MTDTEFRQQYRFVKLISEQGSRTYHALDAAGRGVLVHYLPAGSPETQRLLALLDATPAAAQYAVQRVEVDGTPVLVTEAIPNFQSLAMWLQGFQKTRAPAAGAGAGDMTQLFGPSAPAAAPSPPTPKIPAPAPPPTASEETLVLEAITERHVSVPSPVPPPAAAPPQPPPPPPPPPQKPQEKKPNIRWREAAAADGAADRPVVRWKKDAPPPVPEPPPPAPAPPPPSSPPPRSGAPKQVGEFTQLFGPGGASSPAPTGHDPGPVKESPRAPSVPPPGTPAPPEFGGPPRTEPGEFTRLFNPESRPDPSPPARPQPPPRDLLQELNAPASPPPLAPPAGSAPPTSAPGEFTRMMAGVSPPAAAQTPAAGSVAPPAGPSEFTRMIKGLAPRAASAPAAATPAAKTEPAADAESPRSRRLVVLVVVLGALTVFAIGLVLYFVLRAP